MLYFNVSTVPWNMYSVWFEAGVSTPAPALSVSHSLTHSVSLFLSQERCTRKFPSNHTTNKITYIS